VPHFAKLTPNLIVANVERSLRFYSDVLGFSRGITVPDQAPFVFASATKDAVEIFFNEAAAATSEYPIFAGKPIGASGTLYIEVDSADTLHEQINDRVQVVMALVNQFYGTREFAIADPDGYVITFASRVST
jgi:lactoylglutathione lyase